MQFFPRGIERFRWFPICVFLLWSFWHWRFINFFFGRRCFYNTSSLKTILLRLVWWLGYILCFFYKGISVILLNYLRACSFLLLFRLTQVNFRAFDRTWILDYRALDRARIWCLALLIQYFIRSLFLQSTSRGCLEIAIFPWLISRLCWHYSRCVYWLTRLSLRLWLLLWSKFFFINEWFCCSRGICWNTWSSRNLRSWSTFSWLVSSLGILLSNRTSACVLSSRILYSLTFCHSLIKIINLSLILDGFVLITIIIWSQILILNIICILIHLLNFLTLCTLACFTFLKSTCSCRLHKSW